MTKKYVPYSTPERGTNFNTAEDEMKKIILAAAIAVLLTALQSGAAVLLYESFSGYANGDLPGQSYQGTGFKAGGFWWGDAADASTVTNAGGLSYSGLLVSGGKARTRGNGPNTEAVPDMSVGGPFDTAGLVDAPGTASSRIGRGTIQGTLYYSFLARKVQPENDDEYGGFHLYRGNSEGCLAGNTWWAWAYSVMMGPDYDLIDNYGLGDFMYGNTTTRFFVVKVIYTSGADDTVAVWMDPDLAETEANQGSNVYVLPELTIEVDASFDNFRLRSGGNAIRQWEFDEIRFGETWDDVTPIPEPALALVALCGFVALLRRK